MQGWLLLCCGWLLALAPLCGEETRLRTWTSDDGRTLRAAYLGGSDDRVRLRLEGGREVELAVSRLSEEDAAFIAALRQRERAREEERLRAPLPPRSELEGAVEVEGGPRVFRTPNFEFETDEAVSRAFIAEASRVYEGTLLAVNSLPHGLKFAPEEGERYRGRFLTDEAFDEIAASKVPAVRGQRVAGLYFAAERELLVPYSSLGARTLGSRQTLRKSSDTSTLVHEIVHQVMDRWLVVLPIWFSEGFAEYFAALPYQNGRFDFSNAERGLRERLRSHYGESGRELSGVRRPSSWLPAIPSRASAAEGGLTQAGSGADEVEQGNASAPTAFSSTSGGEGASAGWGGSLSDYRDAMLLVYYFMHLQRPQEPGRIVGAYLRRIDGAMEETESLRLEVADYEARRRAYNESVQRFNERLGAFRLEVEGYNERVKRHNGELLRGVPEPERTEVGPAPEAPEPPETLELPESLSRVAERGRVDLPALVRERGAEVLLGGGSPEDLDRAFLEAFRGIGWELRFRN